MISKKDSPKVVITPDNDDRPVELGAVAKKIFFSSKPIIRVSRKEWGVFISKYGR